MKIQSVLLVCLVSLTALVAGCQSDGTEAASKRPPATVMADTVRTETITLTTDLIGSVEPIRTAVMASPAEGPVLECGAREGDRVKQGDLLVAIGRHQASTALVASAKSEVSRLQSEYDAVAGLVASGSVPAEQQDIAQVNLEEATASLAAARTGEDDFAVRAPWDGVVLQLDVAEGNFVTPRQKLATLFDPASLVVCFDVPERFSAQVRDSMACVVRLDAYPDQNFNGHVSRVYPGLDRGSRTQRIEVELQVMPQRLAPGMFARTSLVIQRVADAVVVPVAALQVTPDGHTVVYVVEGKKVARRRVETGIQEGDHIQALSGLSAGDLVVVAGNEHLKDGQPVKVLGAKSGAGQGSRP